MQKKYYAIVRQYGPREVTVIVRSLIIDRWAVSFLLLAALFLSFNAEARLWYMMDWSVEQTDPNNPVEIAGYEVHTGTTPECLDGAVHTVSAGVCVWGLNPYSTPAGTVMYASVRSVNTQGGKGDFSAVVELGIPPDLTEQERMRWNLRFLKCFGR